MPMQAADGAGPESVCACGCETPRSSLTRRCRNLGAAPGSVRYVDLNGRTALVTGGSGEARRCRGRTSTPTRRPGAGARGSVEPRERLFHHLLGLRARVGALARLLDLGEARVDDRVAFVQDDGDEVVVGVGVDILGRE